MEHYNTLSETLNQLNPLDYHFMGMNTIGMKEIQGDDIQFADGYFYNSSMNANFKMEYIMDENLNFGNEKHQMDVDQHHSENSSQEDVHIYKEQSHSQKLFEEAPIKKVFSLNLFDMAFDATKIDRSLSQPSFRSSDSSHIFGVVGTEEQDEDLLNLNHLIFFEISDSSKVNEGRTASFWTVRVSDCVRDIKWIDDYHVLFAQGSSLGICALGFDANVREMTEFPSWHKDHIREIDVKDHRLVLSGGFDGQLFLTDIAKSSEDSQRNLSNVLYKTSDVIGSVKWNPYVNFQASFTIDSGYLNIIDTRERKVVTRIVSSHKDLYTHEYIDENHIVFGFGDGKMKIYDIRNPHCAKFSYQDPKLSAIGDIIFNKEKELISAWGIPGFSIYSLENGGSNIFSSINENSLDSKKIGDYVNGTDMIGCTDSDGKFELYSLQA